jgi:hypothetical protein
MTAALSDHSPDQIFRSARSFNGWADRAVEDSTVREIYDLMKWRPTSASFSAALRSSSRIRTALDSSSGRRTRYLLSSKAALTSARSSLATSEGKGVFAG